MDSKMNRRHFFSGLTTSAAVIGALAFASPMSARTDLATPAIFDYPQNPLHFRAMLLLREAAKTLLKDDKSGLTTISATCRHLRGEVGTYDTWLVTMYAFDALYRATESLAEMGLGKDQINAALQRLDIEMELKTPLMAHASAQEV